MKKKLARRTSKEYVVSNERIPSGIPGLDKLIEGGFLKNSTILISGGAGTGKTIMCSQFIWEGLKRGEKCMYITLEEKPEDIISDVERFGWDFRKYINEKKLILTYKDPFQVTDITSPLIEEITEHKVSRVAIDSSSVLGLYFKDASEIRKQLFKLVSSLKSAGVTTLLTSEIIDENKLSRFGVEEFITDGVLILQFLGLGGKASFNLQVRKMRRTSHKKESFPFEISDKGIRVLSS